MATYTLLLRDPIVGAVVLGLLVAARYPALQLPHTGCGAVAAPAAVCEDAGADTALLGMEMEGCEGGGGRGTSAAWTAVRAESVAVRLMMRVEEKCMLWFGFAKEGDGVGCWVRLLVVIVGC